MTKVLTNIYRILLLSILLCAHLQASASAKGEYFLSGMVRDSLTLEPLAFASVTVGGKAVGALTNEKGIFELTVPNDASELIVTCLGYNKRIEPIRKRQVNMYDIWLSPSTTELKEVVVRRQKYSKKNNPAVEFMHQLKDKGPMTDPRRNDYYNYDKHAILTFGLNDFGAKDENSALFKRFPFLWEHVDTSEVSGKPILNVLVKERSSEVHYRKSPKSEKEYVVARRQEGIDEIGTQDNIETFLNDVLREIDLYENDINILQNRFVSPLSRIAPDFYKFYLTDTVKVDDEDCIVLSFYPHNQAAFGFNGQIFVPVNDSTMFIKKVTMRTPRNINLNFIENLYISQEFDRAPDGSRLKKRDDMTIEAKVMTGTPGMYVRRSVAYGNHDFNPPIDMSIFDYMQDEIFAEEADQRDIAFWEAARLMGVSDNDKRIGTLMQKLRSVPVFYYAEKGLKILFSGYVTTGKDSKFDYGPVNTTFSHNPIEGIRLRAGGMTTANLSPHIYSRAYVAYGTKDHKWKYGVELEYSFREKKYHSREFPMHLLRVSSLYDVDLLGQHYMFTNQDNFFLSLKRMEDLMATYRQVNRLEYFLELYNNFSVVATLKNERQIATPYIQFVDGYGKNYRNFVTNSFELQLRYAPGEKYYQTKSYRIPINLDAPVFILSHSIAPQGWVGTTFMVNKTEASFQKRFWFSAFGFTDVILKGGHVWSRSPFNSLLIPNANLSYTIQPESYAMLNPLEFINDSYASADVTYWLNGAVLNYIPGIKKLKLREVVSFKALWGTLSENNDPDLHPELFRFPAMAHVTRMTNRPYMELSAGFDNILRCLRIDYVWRLSYLDVPYQIDRHGLRVAMHVTF